jgi:hypothetical protein
MFISPATQFNTQLTAAVLELRDVIHLRDESCNSVLIAMNVIEAVELIHSLENAVAKITQRNATKIRKAS